MDEPEISGKRFRTMDVPRSEPDGNFNQVPLFFSHFFCPQALDQDALSQLWYFRLVYIFAPTALILRSLAKIVEEDFLAITIAPFCFFLLLSAGDLPSNQATSGARPAF